MFYWISYYVKKYWYILVLLIICLFVILILYMNRGDLNFMFEKFDNKVIFKQQNVTESKLDNPTNYLSTIVAEKPYIGEYVPDYVDDSEKDKFLAELKEDPTLIYKKDISWANGSISNDEFKELIELVGYHLNQQNVGKTIIVEPQSEEQMQELGNEVLVYTDEDGVLYMNLYVEEIDTASSTSKTYCYTFQLHYELDGKINIS